MEAELKAKWVAALKGGGYAQCTGLLHDGRYGYCCLGVLAHVRGQDPLRYPEEEVLSENDADKLIAMNDGNAVKNIRRHSFPEIADYIEANL